jgi:hypothetical protein
MSKMSLTLLEQGEGEKVLFRERLVNRGELVLSTVCYHGRRG